VSALELLRRPEYDAARLALVVPALADFSEGARRRVAADVKYEGYAARHEREAAATRAQEAVLLPPATRYDDIAALGTEARATLTRVKPRTLGEAARLQGVTPADLVVLLRYVKKGAAAGPTADQAR
jgi:tRNA uridine 5-carboxymethylaminomethyl modification enzyme